MISGLTVTAELNALRLILSQRGEDVTVNLTTTKSIAIRAALTKPVSRRRDVIDVAMLESKKWDWLLDGRELIDPETNQAFEPRKGMSIVRSDGTKWRLVPADNSEMLFRWSSPARIQMRIHSEEV
jgi:hypothetical protein